MRKLTPSLIVVLAVVALNAAISVRGLWPGTAAGLADAVVRSDVKGYYGYLQALFIRKDLGREQPVWEYVRHTPTGTLNKYYCGTAVMMAPWFLIGHDIALGDPKAPRDGLSVHEMRAISIGAWCYLLIGLLAIRALLRRMAFAEGTVAWVLIAIGFGTQLMQYSALQPGWSHVYSFSAVSLFLLTAHRFATARSVRWLVAAAALLGLIVLIRPVNGLVLLALPVVLGDAWQDALRRAVQHPLILVIAVIACGAVVSIQPLLWYAQIGKWYAYGYTGEGFHWDRPEALKVLFGFRRGLFLWTPVLLLALFGMGWLLLKDRARGIGMLLYWAANLYVISAWWIWYYGSGFGSRVFVDHYPVLAMPMAFVLQAATKRGLLFARGFIALCCALLLFQMWQYSAGILHPESMDRVKYAYAFLRWDDSYRHALGGNYQEPPFSPNGMSVVLEESCDFEHACAHWGGGAIRSRHDAYSGGNAAVFDGSDEYGLQFEAGTDELPAGRALYLEVGLQRREERSLDAHALLGVTDVRKPDGSVAYYEPFPFNPMPAKPGTWEQIEYRIPVPPLEEGDRLKFYFWDKDRRSRVLIDDVFVRVNAVNPY
ncbi:MAG: hypothetical protein IPM12_03030 [Flavobacteriales bacterium]|nr:hypothetical protein [Flavobacteriales bacterium]